VRQQGNAAKQNPHSLQKGWGFLVFGAGVVELAATIELSWRRK